MSEFKPTPGEWNQGASNEGSTCVWFHGIKEPEHQMGKDSEWIDCNTSDNAKLIADAGNTYHSTGMTPSQLAERVKVLEDALRTIIKDEITVYDDHDGCDCIVSMDTDDMIKVAEKALAK